MLAERNALAAIHRIKGIIEQVLLQDHKMSRAQLNALWTYVGHKGEKKGFQKRTIAADSGAGR